MARNAYLTAQIPEIVIDAFKDAVGTSDAASEIDTSDFVSMGKAMSDFALLDRWYGALTRRIARTIFFARQYNAKTRGIIRDEISWGAFIQKVYFMMPSEVDNPAYGIPQDVVGQDDPAYAQASPYDVETPLAVKAVIYGNSGTWSYEFISPLVQLKTAWTSPAEMAAFVDGQFVAVRNRIEKAKEVVINSAVNTAMANALANGYSVNLLKAYNDAHDAGDALTADECLESAAFLKFASKEINKTAKFMKNMSNRYNSEGFETFTDDAHMKVEVLTEFAQDASYYLDADTFNMNMVQLPGFESVDFWQIQGDSSFDVCSSINVLNTEVDENAVEQTGIIACIRDTEAVSAYFGDEYQWTETNVRNRVSIHGYQYVKGYGIDKFANCAVFYIADVEEPDPEPGENIS